jgi:hypothetical protein
MGSMIHLGTGRLEIEWGKNNGFVDHIALFQESDVALVLYYCAGEQIPAALGDGLACQT